MQMNKRIIIAPSKYIQGPGEIKNLSTYYKALGQRKAFLIVSPSNLRNNLDKIIESFEKEDISYEIVQFGGECCKSEIDRLVGLVGDADVIIGIGGGKITDTAKAVAYYANLPIIIAPSTASSDAPCSSSSVLYTEDGVFESVLILRANPNCIVLDTTIVAKAPSRLLVSGMGDALATFFEARSVNTACACTLAGGLSSLSALALAKLCYDTLLSDGLKAKLAVDAGFSSKAVENIIEANTFLSGIGFESGGIGAAHSVCNGLTILPETHGAYHGEKVAFGTLAQLVLENACRDEISAVIDFCRSVGLPTNLSQLGVKEITPEKLMAVATASCAPGQPLHDAAFAATPELVYSAIVVADQMGT